jgi:THO complex subunit 5
MMGVTGAGTDDVKLEEEVLEDDDDSPRCRKRVKITPEKEIVEEDNIYRPHPLVLIVPIFDNKQKMSKLLALRFQFLTKIDVLCAGIEGASYGGGDPDTLLANLFPDDARVDLPNQISKLQAGPGFPFDQKRHSWPYKWVRHLGGTPSFPGERWRWSEWL